MPAESPFRGARVLAALPVLVPVFLAFLTASSTLLMLCRAFEGLAALAMAIALTALVAPRLDLRSGVLSRSAIAADLLAVVLALSFAGVNAKYASQNLIIGRDPGVYAVTSQWLVDHRSTDVGGIDPHQDARGPGAVEAFEAFEGSPGVLRLPLNRIEASAL